MPLWIKSHVRHLVTEHFSEGHTLQGFIKYVLVIAFQSYHFVLGMQMCLFVLHTHHIIHKQDRQCKYHVYATIVAVEKQWVLHIMSVFVTFGIQHAMHTHQTVICGLPGSTVVFCITSKMARLKKTMVVFLYKFVWNISHTKMKWVRNDQKCILVFMQSTCYSCLILMKPEFSDRFWKNNHMSNVMKIHPVAAELFHADGQTWRS